MAMCREKKHGVDALKAETPALQWPPISPDDDRPQVHHLWRLIEAMPDPPNCLLVFVDDTGDPAYRDPVNPVFGLGGCAVLARDLERAVRGPWAAVRTALGGRPDAKLHAKRVERRMTKSQETAIRSFFVDQPFRRVAYVSSIRTRYDGGPEDAVMRSTAATLAQRILEVAKWMPFSSIIAIFEHNAALAIAHRGGFRRHPLSGGRPHHPARMVLDVEARRRARAGGRRLHDAHNRGLLPQRPRSAKQVCRQIQRNLRDRG